MRIFLQNSKPALCGLLFFCGTNLARADDAARDFDMLWDTVSKQYAYFDDADIAERWDCVRTTLRPKAQGANKETLLRVLEQALDALTDFHAHMNVNGRHSWRLVPSGTDVRAHWDGTTATITDVRARAPAARMGVRSGDLVREVNGKPVAEAISAARPICVPSTIAADQWALQRALAGTHDTPRHLTVAHRDGTVRTLWLGIPDAQPSPMPAKTLPDGSVVIPITHLGDEKTLLRFERQLKAHQEARAFILDLRETATGGNTGVAEPILGRFIEAPRAYQRLSARNGPPTNRIADPRGPFTITQPVAVVVGAWTSSMGEGLAIGLNAIRGAPVVGAPMAGLRGAVETFTLPASGWRFSIPTLKITHVDGTPREAFVPEGVRRNEYGTDLVYRAAMRALGLTAPNDSPPDAVSKKTP